MKKSKSRLEINKELLSKLEILINKYPEQRFTQILCNYVLPKDLYIESSAIVNNVTVMKDIFYIESSTLLNNINTNIDYGSN